MTCVPREMSIVSEFDLQCSKWKVSIVDGMFFAGILVGASLFGYLSDRMGRSPVAVSHTLSLFPSGRRTIMYTTVALSGFACISTSVATSYWWYLIFRTVIGHPPVASLSAVAHSSVQVSGPAARR